MRLMMHAGNLFMRWNALTGKLHSGFSVTVSMAILPSGFFPMTPAAASK